LTATGAACGGDDDSATEGESSVAAASVLPSAFIRFGTGEAVELAPGTRCWQGRCIDMAGPMTQVEPLPLYAGEPVAFSFEAGIPTEFTVSWTKAPATAPAPEGDVRVWAGLFTGDAHHSGPTVPDATGAYIITLFAKWEDKGDITYGLYANVTEGPEGS
jgi:hypothetical protein